MLLLSRYRMMIMMMMIYIYNDGVSVSEWVSNEKVTTSWIVDDDDIYIMTECLSVSEWVASALPLTASHYLSLDSYQRHQLKPYYNYYSFLWWLIEVFIYFDQISNWNCLSLCLSLNFYFPPSWAPQTRSEAWEVYSWELYPPDDPPRPSQPKAGQGLVIYI